METIVWTKEKFSEKQTEGQVTITVSLSVMSENLLYILGDSI